MKIFSECNLSQIVVDILNGKTIVFPTETSYGLGCDATNQEAVNKIFEIKGRSDDKPLLIVVPSVEEAKKYLVWNEELEKLASKFWPGELTVVGEFKFKAKKKIWQRIKDTGFIFWVLTLLDSQEYTGNRFKRAIKTVLNVDTSFEVGKQNNVLENDSRHKFLVRGVVGKDGTVAVRVTAHPLLKSITEKTGSPLVATSANLAGEPSLYNGEEIAGIFESRTAKPDIVLNYGILPSNPATTLVSVVGGEVKVLRQGSVVIQ